MQSSRPQVKQPESPGIFEHLVHCLLQPGGDAAQTRFLHDTGTRLARVCPLAEAVTLSELEIRCNQQLAALKLGHAKIKSDPHSLLIVHYECAVLSDPAYTQMHQDAMSDILSGLYSEWLLQQGGAETMTVVREDSDHTSCLLFRYKLREQQ